jgi:hypothetical protein
MILDGEDVRPLSYNHMGGPPLIFIYAFIILNITTSAEGSEDLIQVMNRYSFQCHE